jgi:hypothetical protein
MKVKDEPLLLWLLREYCQTNEIDPHEIDSHLTFGENKTLLEQRFGTLRTPSIYRRRK